LARHDGRKARNGWRGLRDGLDGQRTRRSGRDLCSMGVRDLATTRERTRLRFAVSSGLPIGTYAAFRRGLLAASACLPRWGRSLVTGEQRRLRLLHKNRSTNCREVAPTREATTSARSSDVPTHKRTPTRAATTVVRSADQAELSIPACCSRKGASVQPARVLTANRRARSLAPPPHRRRRRCRPSAKKIAVRKTRGASLTVPKLHLEFC
jgi:hypothetical protein